MADLRLAIFTGNYNHIKDGVSLTLNRLVQFLNEKGISVIVFGPSVENPVLNHAGTFVEVPSISIPGRSEYRLSLGLSPKAQRILEDFSPNLVQISTPDLLGYQAFKWAKANRVARVASYHTHFTSYLHYYYLDLLEEFGWKFMRWLYGQCSHVYVPTLSMAEELKKHGIEKGLRIWSRGVDLNKFSPEKRNGVWRKEHGFEKDDIIVSYVSRLVWEKEPMTFARSVELAARSNPKIKPMVVGEGPAHGDLKELLPNAHFLGFLTGKELADAYANSDIFAFPSLSETFWECDFRGYGKWLTLCCSRCGREQIVNC